MSNHAVSGRSVEASGRTVELAVEAALARLGKRRDEVDVQVLREGSRGVLGFGAQDAIVRVTEQMAAPAPVAPAPVPAPPPQPTVAPVPPAVAPVEAAIDAVEDEGDEDEVEDEGPRPVVEPGDETLLESGREVLLELLQRMGVIADVLASWEEADEGRDEPTLVLDIIGDDLGLLIGRRGETLRDLQYIVRLLVGKRIGGWANIIVDVEGYKQRRERTLRQMARRMAERVRDTGRPAHMEPLNPYERRIVHMELQQISGIRTESSGEDPHRRVGIFPA